MIPNTNLLTQKITEITYKGRTYKIEFIDEQFVTPKAKISTTVNSILGSLVLGTVQLGVNEEVVSESDLPDRINGYIDGIDAIIQAIYLILNTERYKYVIYSWDYGVELVDLFGRPMPYVMSELPRRIKEALIQDNRISDVVDFEFEVNHHKLFTTFNVITNIGKVSAELEVLV